MNDELKEYMNKLTKAQEEIMQGVFELGRAVGKAEIKKE